ncbi:DNA-methyltransferase [Carnobacterium maltaromaticum]|uniref:DNA-methyltransferase n=1 Tax=Carnobacterium maltaromaticum TaxID=2751 RepID=UPI00295F268D|nr:DNA methyltransferase [Carnobacterium maltaromaticum]
MEINKVIHGDSIEYMKSMSDDSVDIIIADPPYNLSKGGNYKISQGNKPKGFGGDWNKVMETWDNMPLMDYFQFTIDWLTEAKRILRSTGSIWIHGSYHNIGIINFAMQLIDFEIINEVVWYKRNSFPNLTGKRLTASHETILWGHSGNPQKREYNFNYDYSKEVEYPEDMMKKTGKQMRTVWDVPNNKKKEELKFGKHPTQKPIRLIKRMLELSAKEGDLVFTPFNGSGTEVVAAKMLGLDYLGVEMEKEYVDICELRLDNTPKGDYFSNHENDRNEGESEQLNLL